MPKTNCWEFMKCGREPGGMNVDEFGVCAAAVETSTDGINGGKNGGRACWAISGTYCEGGVQGTFAAKLGDCRRCDFYKSVQREQGRLCKNTREIRRAYMLCRLAHQVGDNYRELLCLR